jgi:hypothetical protein
VASVTLVSLSPLEDAVNVHWTGCSVGLRACQDATGSGIKP